jgi:hypothetical protein
MKAFMVGALKKAAPTAKLANDDQELKRQAALASRRSQKSAQEQAAAAIGAKFPDPTEDPEVLQDDVDNLRQEIFFLEGEIRDLEASKSINFPSPSEIANVSNAVGVLQARVASSAAANSIMTAATSVMSAWNL